MASAPSAVVPEEIREAIYEEEESFKEGNVLLFCGEVLVELGLRPYAEPTECATREEMASLDSTIGNVHEETVTYYYVLEGRR